MNFRARASARAFFVPGESSEDCRDTGWEQTAGFRDEGVPLPEPLSEALQPRLSGFGGHPLFLGEAESGLE